MESRGERVTVRLTPTELAMFASGAAGVGIEISRYLRDCARMGHKLRDAGVLAQVTGG